MTSLTLSIDDKLLQAARLRALKEGTSVNDICRKAIESYARGANQDRLERYLALQARIDDIPRPAGAAGAAWRGRDELYEHLLSERSPSVAPAAADVGAEGGARKR